MRRRSQAVVVVVAAWLGAACSSDSAKDAAPSPTAAPTSATAASPTSAASANTSAPEASTADTTPAAPACAPPTTTTPISAADVGNDRDYDIVSFDGTVIRAHWFPAAADDATAPTVLMGPGWSAAGDVNEDAPGLLGALSIKTLRDNGYNVLTWDPRGFGESTGVVQIDSVDFEGRDVQQLLDWVATQPQAQLDATRDPRVGMVGASYGGGIQLVTAAIDCRVDAIVPIIAWHSLQTSLYKANTAKTGWGNVLAGSAAGANLDPHITDAAAAGNSAGTFPEADVQFFAERGPGDLVSQITVPTLIIQGTVDTLFTLDEAVTNYRLLQESGVPVSMLWFCGGHGDCLTNPGDETRVDGAAIGWLDRYVKGDTAVDTGAAFEFVDQNGVSYTDTDLPEADGTPLTATGAGTLQLVADGGAGPVTPPPGATADVVGSVALSITPGKATNAVNVTVAAPAEPALVVGAPTLKLTYSGTADAGERPTRVFAQLVDDATGLVLGNQITPIEVTLDGQEHKAEVPLEMVAHLVLPGTTITLQVVATTVAYAQPRLGGTIEFSAIDVKLPVVTSPVANAG